MYIFFNHLYRVRSLLALTLILAGFVWSIPPVSADSNTWMMRCFESVNRPEVAIHTCTLALKSTELDRVNRAITLVNRGEAYRRDGQYRAAIQDFSFAIEINSNMPEAYLNRAAALERIDARQDAIADYSKAIELRPNFPAAYFGRANALSDLGLNDRALKDYDRAIRLSPRRGEYYYNRGLLLEKQSRDSDAALDFLKAYELLPNNPITRKKAATIRLNM